MIYKTFIKAGLHKIMEEGYDNTNPFRKIYTFAKTVSGQAKKRSAGRQTTFLTVYKFFYAAPVSNTLFISTLFCCMVEWTYRFNVICTLECPKISLRLFTSKPLLIHRLAK